LGHSGGSVPFGSGTKLFEKKCSRLGPEFKTILKIPGFRFFLILVPAKMMLNFLKWRVANELTGF
jgi:hypothetical protein